jgi:hypothetical protein
VITFTPSSGLLEGEASEVLKCEFVGKESYFFEFQIPFIVEKSIVNYIYVKRYYFKLENIFFIKTWI